MGTVAGSAGCGCVGTVAEHDQSVSDLVGLTHRLDDGDQLRQVILAPLPHVGSKGVASGARQFRIVIGHNHDRTAQLGGIEPRLHRGQPGAEVMRVGFQLLQLPTELVTDGLEVLRVRPLGGYDQRKLLERHDRPGAVHQDATQHRSRALAGLNDVHVWIGVVQHQGVGCFDHPPGDVHVQVERGHHRHFAPN